MFCEDWWSWAGSIPFKLESAYNYHPTYRAFITFAHLGMDSVRDYGSIPCCHGWDNSCRNLYTDSVILKAHRTTSVLGIILNNLSRLTMTVLPSSMDFSTLCKASYLLISWLRDCRKTFSSESQALPRSPCQRYSCWCLLFPERGYPGAEKGGEAENITGETWA